MTDELRIPTARECLAEAYRLLSLGGSADSSPARQAEQWIIMARELREEAFARRMWQPVAASLPAAAVPAEPKLTLHDVAGIVCSHGLVAVRWKDDDPASHDWWRHVDGTSCDNADPAGDMFRRRSQAMREQYGDGADEQVPVRVSAVEVVNGVEVPIGQPRDTTTSRSALDLLHGLDAGQRIEDNPADTAIVEVAYTIGDPDATMTSLARPYVDGTQWDRAQDRHPLDVTAALPFPLPRIAPPVEGAEGMCRNHNELNGLIIRDGKWVHIATGQALCPIPGQTPEGDETYHRFANPV